MITLKINGEEHQYDATPTIEQVITERGAALTNVAVAVGGKMVPRTEWQSTELHNGDNIIVIKASYGG
ncbi:MAG: sulfur carrier protein ThiS [Bacteroidales bacterium]|nr:sulfur carrier protein ThiS [Bacteroidales bacterium]MDD6668892.1 sulfur carrier protein ThiS [Bacteroidales bacterium]